MSIPISKKEEYENDSLWKKVKELTSLGRFKEAINLAVIIYNKYDE